MDKINIESNLTAKEMFDNNIEFLVQIFNKLEPELQLELSSELGAIVVDPKYLSHLK